MGYLFEELIEFVEGRKIVLPSGGQLTPFIGFADPAHFARVSWYQQCVLPLIGERKTCMEHVMYTTLSLSYLHNPDSFQKTYFVGSMIEGPFMLDVDGGGSCWVPSDSIDPMLGMPFKSGGCDHPFDPK